MNLTILKIDTSISISGPTITANIIGATYQWLDCGAGYTALAGETGRKFTATANGDYAVEITENSCTDTTRCLSITTIGLLNHDPFDNISIAPNPTTGLVNIFLANLKGVSVSVLDAIGDEVYHADNIKNSVHYVELGSLPGIYFIEVTVNGKKKWYKVIKE